MFRIRVAASSANLGVGFDVLGLALNLYNTFTFKRSTSFHFRGFSEEYSTLETNLVYKSYIEVFRYLECEPIPVEIGGEFEIPIKRGLGSSSSLIVAGVFGANALLGNPLDKRTLFNICTEIEGHPDNVCPAIYGGLTSALKRDDTYEAFKYKVSDRLHFSVLIPPYEVETKKARKILPLALTYNDVVHNMSRIILLPRAFREGRITLLRDLLDDKLHEPYRGKLIRGYNEIKEALRRRGAVSCISGSGSTILIISNKEIEYSFSDYKFIAVKPGDGILVEEI